MTWRHAFGVAAKHVFAAAIMLTADAPKACHPLFTECQYDCDSFDDRRRITHLDRAALAELQLEKLNRLLAEVLADNAFYQRKLAGCPAQLESLDQLATLPHTTKEELQPAAGDEPFAANRTYPIDRYVRCHQTSGTRGRPLVVLDTAEDWQWWIDCWQYVLDAAEVTPSDRALLAFSFGPFIGFWSAFDALVARGALVIPGGGLGSLARIEVIRNARVTTLLCTPTYALRLAEVAAEHKINLAELAVEKIIVAGEPGGSVPAIARAHRIGLGRPRHRSRRRDRNRPLGIRRCRRPRPARQRSRVHRRVRFGRNGPAGQRRRAVAPDPHDARPHGAPVIRYRTGDLVRPVWAASESNRFVLLEAASWAGPTT